MRELSSIAKNIPESMTLFVNDRAKALRASGQDIIALAGGDPDFDTPAHITAAALSAINNGQTHYPSPMKGIKPLLEAIGEKMARDNDVHINPLTDVVVTPGGKWAINLALSVILNPGDEVLYFDPYWVSYPFIIMIQGGVPMVVQLNSADNFHISVDLIRAQITSRTKAILVNTPNNPTGRVLTQQEVDAITAVACEHDLYVICDEIYEKLIYDGRKHISLASQPGMAERTFVVNGFSKSYAMTGWRMGWLAGPTEAMKIASRINGQTISSSATFTMIASAEALAGPQDCITEMRDAYQARRDFMVPALNAIDGVECPSIEGAFYLMARFPNSDKDSMQLSEALLDKAGIAGTPGAAFGQAAEGHVRFSIATAMSDLERAVERIAKIAYEL